MKTVFFNALTIFLITTILTSCGSYKQHLKEEVVLKNGNSKTGKIIDSDSLKITIRQKDASAIIIPWEDVDSIKSIKRHTLMLSVNGGIHYSPYYSVFRNENYYPTSPGLAFRIGSAKYGKRFRYINFAFQASNPHKINKIGYGFQRYFVHNYLSKWNLYAGSELNLWNIRYNNYPSFYIEPFLGSEFKLNEIFRANTSIGFAFAPISKIDKNGFNFSVGINYLFINFKKRNIQLLETRKL